MNRFEKRALATRVYRALRKAAGLNELPRRIRKQYDNTPSFTESAFQRKLTPDEIENASNDLKVDFVSKGLIPLYDKGDNDFVVYNTKTKRLEMFNIADELSFMADNPKNLVFRR